MDFLCTFDPDPVNIRAGLPKAQVKRKVLILSSLVIDNLGK